MSIVDFYFEGKNLQIQCNKYDKMNQIFQKFYSKAGVNPNSIAFLYNGDNITNKDSTFDQLANIDDKRRNKMNILVSYLPYNSSSQFIFETVVGADESMKDFAKMVILLALKEYPDNDCYNNNKCLLIVNKFHEHYGGYWCCSFFKEGESIFNYIDYFIRIRYDNYIIKIAKTSD